MWSYTRKHPEYKWEIARARLCMKRAYTVVVVCYTVAAAIRGIYYMGKSHIAARCVCATGSLSRATFLRKEQERETAARGKRHPSLRAHEPRGAHPAAASASHAVYRGATNNIYAGNSEYPGKFNDYSMQMKLLQHQGDKARARGPPPMLQYVSLDTHTASINSTQHSTSLPIKRYVFYIL